MQDVNDDELGLVATADFLAELRPATVYVAIPTRPPSESWAQAPPEEDVHAAYDLFARSLDRVEFLIGYEGNAFMATGNPTEDLLGITAVHPMREDAVLALLESAGADMSLVDGLIEDGKLVRLFHKGHTFYMRSLPKVLRVS